MKFDLTELDRRISNLIRIGSIEEADYRAAKLRIRSGQILTDWLPWITNRAGGDVSWHAPEVGEQVIVLSPSGELNQGVVIAGLFQSAYPQPLDTPEKRLTAYKDGAVIEYDREAHRLKIILPAGATTELVSVGGIAITGDLFVDGNINASKEIADHKRSMQADRDIYNAHDHADPQGGKVVATEQRQ